MQNPVTELVTTVILWYATAHPAEAYTNIIYGPCNRGSSMQAHGLAQCSINFWFWLQKPWISCYQMLQRLVSFRTHRGPSRNLLGGVWEVPEDRSVVNISAFGFATTVYISIGNWLWSLLVSKTISRPTVKVVMCRAISQQCGRWTTPKRGRSNILPATKSR